MKVLEIGGGPNPRSIRDEHYRREDVTILDAQANGFTDVIHAVTTDNKLPFDDNMFDVVYSSHILEHLPWWADENILKDWTRVVKPGGILVTIVPSWEWVAKEVLKDPARRSGGLKACAFAGQDNEWDRHENMFTLDMLEDLYKKCRLKVRTSKTRRWRFFVRGRPYSMEENYVVGVKL